ncbi:MAG TPA: RNA 2',3'-cyclic phosphodiesterase [Pyrinomonadaceae bacterium]
MKTEELWRVFCAIELPPHLRERAAEHSARLRAAMPEVRASWDRAEKLHLTIKFLGEIEPYRVQLLEQAAERVGSEAEPFELVLEGTGAFPPRGLPKVLWLGIKDPAGALLGLQRSLEETCAAAGFPRETRPFHPHLTLARLRTPHGARRLATLHMKTLFQPARFPVTDLLVIRSELGPGGSRYTELSRHRLGQRETINATRGSTNTE